MLKRLLKRIFIRGYIHTVGHCDDPKAREIFRAAFDTVTFDLM